MANGQFIIPGSLENDALQRSVDEVFEGPSRRQIDQIFGSTEIDSATLKRVDEVVDNHSGQAIGRALEIAAKQGTLDAFDQLLFEHPELYELIYDVAEGVRVDAELYRASAKPDVLKSSLKERAFGVFLEKPAFEVRLVNAESELGGKMFGNG